MLDVPFRAVLYYVTNRNVQDYVIMKTFCINILHQEQSIILVKVTPHKSVDFWYNCRFCHYFHESLLRKYLSLSFGPIWSINLKVQGRCKIVNVSKRILSAQKDGLETPDQCKVHSLLANDKMSRYIVNPS